jgi:hypothetical protein
LEGFGTQVPEGADAVARLGFVESTLTQKRCGRCNTALGMVSDDPATLRALAVFLES